MKPNLGAAPSVHNIFQEIMAKANGPLVSAASNPKRLLDSKLLGRGSASFSLCAIDDNG